MCLINLGVSFKISGFEIAYRRDSYPREIQELGDIKITRIAIILILIVLSRENFRVSDGRGKRRQENKLDSNNYLLY